jgi:integrase/recombinase XerD
VDLEDNAINYQKGVVTVLKSKNNKTRQVPISDFFLIPLRNYNVERIRIMREYRRSEKQFFLHSDARPYSGNNLNQLLKKIIARTKSEDLLKKNITLHCLRHSIATHLMDAGQSYEYVREFLGHSMVDTTTIYARNRKIKNYYTL